MSKTFRSRLPLHDECGFETKTCRSKMRNEVEESIPTQCSNPNCAAWVDESDVDNDGLCLSCTRRCDESDVFLHIDGGIDVTTHDVGGEG